MTDSQATKENSDARLEMQLRYQYASDFHAGHLHLFSQLNRSDVKFSGTVKQPIVFREAMATLFSIVSSDYRYAPKDRAVYSAFMQMRRSHQHQGLAKAQQAYFQWLFDNDPLAFCVLDPVISVHPDRLVFEVFSKDEGCYASLSFDHSIFDQTDTPQYGTTNIDYSEALSQGLEQMRSFRDTIFSVGQQAVAFKIETAEALADSHIIEKNIQVPVSWLRGFLQVQSAAHLAVDRFQLKAIDLYNALHHLRMHADVKGKRRGLAIELMPSQYPTLILEPTDTVIATTAAPYQGNQAKIIRIWGRRRLALLKRLLPYADTIDVALLGNGMPSYWTLTGKGVSLTLAITGFSSSNWSQALNFDLLLPRQDLTLAAVERVLKHLQSCFVDTLANISQATDLTSSDCFISLQQACQQGLVMFDRALGVYRYRPLTTQPLEMAHFRYRHPAEQQAYDLLSRPAAVSVLDVLVIPTEGIEISATITVIEDKRSYLSKLKLNEEGHVAKAECSCHAIMQHGLAHGPCSHLVVLRMAYAQQQAQRNTNTISQETRLFARRRKGTLEQVQLTLNKNRVFLLSGNLATAKRQQLAFNSVNDARTAYLSKIKQFETSGFIDSTLG